MRPGRPKKEPATRRAVTLNIRLSASERADLDTISASYGKTLSVMLRAVLLQLPMPRPHAPSDLEAFRLCLLLGSNLRQASSFDPQTAAAAARVTEQLAQVFAQLDDTP